MAVCRFEDWRASSRAGGTFRVIAMAGCDERRRIARASAAVRDIAAAATAFAAGWRIGPAFAGVLHDATESFAPAPFATSDIAIATGILLARFDPDTRSGTRER
ncbi:MAG: hypothetical protein OYH76_00685 [Defluviicoccus sp.]|nr:hypothetical protein [Defluviicoccus sp.]MDE0274378.1 hypothetical protein [Defluviicoccus sp.]